ncbi:MAG TPA: EamA family transporter, partial [Thermoleophilaceae bacterium]
RAGADRSRAAAAPPVTGAALALVIPSAAAHAGWNLLAKQSGGGLPYIWLGGVLSLGVLIPASAIATLAAGEELGLSATAAAWMLGAAAIHGTYFFTLQSGYRAADLSVVYPLARGSGPLLSFIAAILLLGESPGVLQVLGAATIVGAVLALGLSAARRAPHDRSGIAWALTTGGLIATYTLWDKHGVDGLDVQPIAYLCGVEIGRALIFLPLVMRRRDELAAEWRHKRRNLLGFAAMAPLSYVLFLFALSLAPVTLVAPLRELSILFGVALGGQFLAEGHTRTRALAAVAIVAGVSAVSIG